MNKHIILSTFCLSALLMAVPASGQNFKQVSDTLTTLLRARTSVKVKAGVTKVKEDENGKLIVTLGENLKDCPWTPELAEEFNAKLKKYLPAKYRGKEIAKVMAGNCDISTLYGYPVNKNTAKPQRFIREIGADEYSKGLSGRTISMWQSHGYYYEAADDRWRFQRAPVFTTIEDLYTQSYVLEFLMPMLENAGAYIIDPRERSHQLNEIICDNDPQFSEERGAGVRMAGRYAEQGSWSNAGVGFADSSISYLPGENPFRAGTARSARCNNSADATASATWSFDIPQTGSYPVYISYRTDKTSTSCAHYKVNAADGPHEYVVNQTVGGRMWVYLGTFQFEQGQTYSVELDNSTPTGGKFVKKSTVSADAVRIGGGMGKILRGPKGGERGQMRISGKPSFVEGAYYNLLWSGADTTLFCKWERDYVKDYAGRGAWTSKLNIPVDLSFAFHTDAGITPDDRIIGTLQIYTYYGDNKAEEYSDGNNRIQGRHLSELVQNEIVKDIREKFEPEWNRRMLWDKSYSESRTTGVPGTLLELLSHQNFADMRLGLDPSFRFEVSRSIYKGILKFVSEYNQVPYVVQPLPVHAFAAQAVDGKAELRWKVALDASEPTSAPDGYLVQTRLGNGSWSKPEKVATTTDGDWLIATLPLQKDVLTSYRVVAYNAGGKSFPSEVLCVAESSATDAKNVLVVNNFTRVAAPAWYDDGTYAGFDTRKERGVGFGVESLCIGDQYEFVRAAKYEGDDAPGWGGTETAKAGMQIAGNTFDFVGKHASALLAMGCSINSASVEAYSAGFCPGRPFALDLICGKQTTTLVGRGALEPRFRLMPESLRSAIRTSAADSTNIIISGSYIASEFSASIYDNVGRPESLAVTDSSYRRTGKEFCASVLGYSYRSAHPCTGSEVKLAHARRGWAAAQFFNFNRVPCPELYTVEQPNGIKFSDNCDAAQSKILMRYDSDVTAALLCQMPGYRTACFGFPLETLLEPDALQAIFERTFSYFNQPTE